MIRVSSKEKIVPRSSPSDDRRIELNWLKGFSMSGEVESAGKLRFWIGRKIASRLRPVAVRPLVYIVQVHLLGKYECNVKFTYRSMEAAKA